MAAIASLPTFTGLKASVSQKVAAQKASPAVMVKVAPMASLKQEAGKALFAAAAAASLCLASPANAAFVLMGANDGALKFVPGELKVKKGEEIVFVNNSGFPHNVVFDEDEVPEGVNVDKISHEEYFDAAKEEYKIKLEKPGVYKYYCEPHQGAGMVAKIIVD